MWNRHVLSRGKFGKEAGCYVNRESSRMLECWVHSNRQSAQDIRQPQFNDLQTTPTSLIPSPSIVSTLAIVKKNSHSVFLYAACCWLVAKEIVDQQEIIFKISKFRRLHPSLNLRLSVQQLQELHHSRYEPIPNKLWPWYKLPISLRNPVLVSNKRDLWCFWEPLTHPGRTLRSVSTTCFKVSGYFWGILIFRREILHVHTRYFTNKFITKIKFPLKFLMPLKPYLYKFCICSSL
jgi:hypothetical protein